MDRLERIRRGWIAWRGRAVEPLIREALARRLPDDTAEAADAVDALAAAGVIGAYWTRTNDVEIDIVGADGGPIARTLLFVGSIKWLDRSPFDDHDLARLHHHRAALTSEPLTTVAVSRAGVACRGLGATYGPDDIVAAWRRMPQPGAGVTP